MTHKCIIWGTSLHSFNSETFGFFYQNFNPPPFFRQLSGAWNKYEVNNPRAGGKYISEELFYIGSELTVFDQGNAKNTRKLNDEEKVRLSGYIAKENLEGRLPSIDSIVSGNNWIENLPPVPKDPNERTLLLLKGLIKLYPSIGSTISLNLNANMSLNTKKDITPFLYALSYCLKEEEFQFLIDTLKKSNDIEIDNSYMGGELNIKVTSNGWKRIKETENKAQTQRKTNTAFIAMWIDSAMDNLKQSIVKAVRNAGYNPLRIDDEILSEIENARFVVCDLTSEEKQPRGSVYFEAGYAKGKNIPVIYTCSEKLQKEIPFDIRQYKILFWKENNMEDFIRELQAHIEDKDIID